MGTWSPNVSANDYYLDIEAKVVETCGLDFFDYLLDNSILTCSNIYTLELIISLKSSI